MIGPLRPSAHVSIHVLSDRGVVLFDEKAQSLLTCNQTAAYLWCRFREGATPASLADDLAALGGLTSNQATELVAECLVAWRRFGLIEGSEHRRYAPNAAGASTVHGPRARGYRKSPSPLATDWQDFNVLGLSCRINYATANLADWVRPILAHLDRLDGKPPRTKAST